MSLSFMLLLTLGAMPQSAHPPAASAGTALNNVQASERAAATAERPGSLRARVHAALRDEAKADGSAKVTPICELIALLAEIRRDTAMVRDDRIELQTLVRNRLRKASDRIARQTARGTQPARVATVRQGSAGVLAQQVQPFGLGLANDRATENFSFDLADVIMKVVVPRMDADRPMVLAQRAARPAVGANILIGGNVGRQQPPDYGPKLVELIQQTIAPDSWDVNGGPGTIMYFSPLRVLVVRQTGEVHDHLGGLLPAMRN